jgi:hypothetical protein
MNTLKEYRESVTALMNEASAMNKDTNALDVLNTFRSLRWAVSELESAIMSDIFPNKEAK